MTQPFLPPSKYFPPAQEADEDGLLAVGGRLNTDRLLDAYRHAIFPWPTYETGELLLWWSPDPRAILEWHALHVSQRLYRTSNSGRFQVTLNQEFSRVIEGCANAQDRLHNTWLTDQMIEAYRQLHQAHYAHSVECWRNGQLVGGVYGVAVGGLFAAESMFYRERDASKVALLRLIWHLASRGFHFMDIQQLTEHTKRFGATEIPRAEYLRRLARALDSPVTFGQNLETI